MRSACTERSLLALATVLIVPFTRAQPVAELVDGIVSVVGKEVVLLSDVRSRQEQMRQQGVPIPVSPAVSQAVMWALELNAQDRPQSVRDWLLALRRKENDLTLEAVARRLLREKGVKADASMLSRFFASEGVSFKKNRARQRTGTAGRGRGARRLAKDAA